MRRSLSPKLPLDAASHTAKPLKVTVEEPMLTWALAEIAHPHIRAAERNANYVAIGAGDTFSAICSLVTVIVREGLSPPCDLVDAVPRWLNAHSHSESEPRLCGRIVQLKSQPRHRLFTTEPPHRYFSGSGTYRRTSKKNA
jgi:hypothetical protein